MVVMVCDGTDGCDSMPICPFFWNKKPQKMKQKMQKTEMSIFPMYFWANSFVILKGKIGKEDAIFEKSLFCEKFLEYDFTWKKCWFQIKIQNFILMTRPSVH